MHNLRLIAAAVPGRIGDAIFAETEIERKECQDICPVYTGPTGEGYPTPELLKESIHTEGPFYRGNRIYCTVIAGGRARAYAWSQHERTDFFHRVGQAKFIQGPLLASRPFIAERIGRRLGLKHR